MFFKARFIVIFFCLCAFLPATAFGLSGEVAWVADGDTFTIIEGQEKVRVRLYGIDTPESDQPFGQQAKQFAESRLDGEWITVEKMDTDHYGRMIGMVYLKDGRCLNELLVKNGLAWVYDRYCTDSFCDYWKNLETRAQDRQAGLWRQDSPQAPWDWRRK